MKFLRIIIFIVLLLLVAATIAVFSINSIVKKGVTSAGSAALGVPVELENIDVKLFQGQLQLDALTIRNPEGFDSDHAIRIGNFRVDLEPSTILKDTIHIRDIQLSGASIIAEGLQADNHRTILDNVKPAGKPKEQPDGEKSGAKKVIIDHFSFSDSQMQLVVDGEVITKVDFPKVELQQIGEKGSAVTVAEAVAQIYRAIASETHQVLKVNQDTLDALIKAKLKGVGIENLEDLKSLKNPKELLEDPEALNNLLDNIQSGE